MYCTSTCSFYVRIARICINRELYVQIAILCRSSDVFKNGHLFKNEKFIDCISIMHMHCLKNTLQRKHFQWKAFYFYRVGEEALKFHFKKNQINVSPDTGCYNILYMFYTFSWAVRNMFQLHLQQLVAAFLWSVQCFRVYFSEKFIYF